MASQPIRILLVDDDKEDFLTIRTLIGSLSNRNCCRDYELVWESRYERGLSQAANYKFDLFLLDYTLGEKTGLDLMEALRAQGFDAPVLLLTAANDEWLDMAALKAGVSDYLVKGRFDAFTLDRSIRYAIEKQKIVQDRVEAEEAARMAYVELKKRSEDLIELNEKLAVELQERKRLENQLIQSQKMESIGELAAGVAHEINNPVAFVKCNLGTMGRYLQLYDQKFELYRCLFALLEQQPALDGAVLDQLQEIEAFRQANNMNFIQQDVPALLSESTEGIQRIEEIVQGLKSFARSEEGDMKETDINECLEKTLRVVWNQLKYRANVHKNYAELPSVQCHGSQISQVFMNLLINAAQAIPDGTMGDIHIQTEAGENEVTIRVSDTGAGIPKDQLARIFDPFFTTKPVGQGTGLGLSVSYGIVEKHGGRITVESEPGQGTTFSITLPVVPREVQAYDRRKPVAPVRKAEAA